MLRSFSFLLCLATTLCAQGTKADYERALSLPQRTANKVFRARVEPHWIGGGDSFWYRVEVAPGKFENVLVDCPTGERKAGYEPVGGDKQALKQLERVRPSRDGGPETSIVFVNKTAGEVKIVWIAADRSRKPYQTLKPGERHEQHTFSGHVWAIESADGKTVAVYEAGEGDGEAVIEGQKSNGQLANAIAAQIDLAYRGYPIEMSGAIHAVLEEMRREIRGTRTGERRKSPAVDTAAAAREWEPFIRENNVWIRRRNIGDEVQLSKDGKEGDAYREPLMLSPDGTRLLVCRVTPEQDHPVYFVESSPKDQVEPKLHKNLYLKPGYRVRR